MHRVLLSEAAHGARMAELFFENAVQRTKQQLAQLLAAEIAAGRLKPFNEGAAAWRLLGAIKGEAHMRAVLGLAPIPPLALSAHVAECVDDFLAAHAAA